MKCFFAGWLTQQVSQPVRRSRTTLVYTILLQLLQAAVVLPPVTSAALPSLQFDVKHRIACVDIQESPEFKVEEGERLIQAQIPVSMLVQHGSTEGLVQLLIRFENPDRSLQVVDYQPKTTLSTDIVGSIGIETKQDKSAILDLTLSGNQAGIRGTTSADFGSKSGKCIKWQHLPPLELLAASGTISRGSGVYFKLKSSKRTSLEGNRNFVLLLRVPRDWQAGILHVDCLARGKQRSVITSSEETVDCGHDRFVVALYASGNKLAQQQADQLIQADATLRKLAGQHQQQILDRAYPYPGYRWVVFLQAAKPQIPPSWLETVLFHMPASEEPWKEKPFGSWARLPDPVQQAAQQYLQAKRQLLLSGGQLPRE